MVQIYWNDFFEYLEGNIELEKMIEEIERKRKIYVEEKVVTIAFISKGRFFSR